MCAALYIFGNYGSGTCPENAVRIGSVAACQRAATFMGKGWQLLGNWDGLGFY